MKSKVTINYETFHLMKLSQMSVIQSLVSKHTIDGEKFTRPKGFLLGYLLKIARGNCSRMCSEKVFKCLLRLPFIIVANTSEPTLLMNVFNCFKILFILHFGGFWVWNKESIVSVSGRVSLWLEKRVKVPERTFNVSVSLHLLKTHLN